MSLEIISMNTMYGLHDNPYNSSSLIRILGAIEDEPSIKARSSQQILF